MDFVKDVSAMSKINYISKWTMWIVYSPQDLPGTADITADVDFDYLRSQASFDILFF